MASTILEVPKSSEVARAEKASPLFHFEEETLPKDRDDYIYGMPEADKFPFNPEALREFLSEMILSNEDTSNERSLSARDFLSVAYLASANCDSVHGFKFIDFLDQLDASPYSHAQRNIPNALEKCLRMGVLIQDLADYPKAARYYMSEDPGIEIEMNRGKSLSAAAQTYAELLLNETQPVANLDQPFKNLTVADYLTSRCAGATITSLLKGEDLLTSTNTLVGTLAQALEQIEETAIEQGLVARSKEDPRRLLALGLN